MRPSEKHSIGARQDGRAEKIPGVKWKASRRISARQFLGYRTHWYHSSVSVKLPVLSHVCFFFLPHNHYLLRIWWTSWTISVGAAGCAWRCEMAPYCVAVLWPAVQSMDLMAAWTQQAVPDPMPHVQQMAEWHCEPDRSLWRRVTNEGLGRTHFFLSPALSRMFSQCR